MRISHRHRFVFLALPRTGSKTVRRLLDPSSDVESVNIRKTTDAFPFFHHISARELKRIFDARGWDWFEYRRFCVVRNPFDRVVSLFHHREKIRSGGNGGQTFWYNARNRIRSLFRDPLVFEDFVARLDPARRRLEETACSFLRGGDGAWLVDDVLRFERLADDLRRYLGRLGLRPVTGAVPHLNATKRRRPYAEYYNAATRRRVSELYREDLDRFRYTFDSARPRH